MLTYAVGLGAFMSNTVGIQFGFDWNAEALSALSNSSLALTPLLAFHNLQFACGECLEMMLSNIGQSNKIADFFQKIDSRVLASC